MHLDGLKYGDKVAVAMSGGVDSSVAAALAVEAGYDVVGITLQLYNHAQVINKSGACCAGQDIYDAKCVADKMNFPHYVLDYESVFNKNVIEDFADSYIKGETPLPCVRCNQKVKFKDLLNTAKELGAKALVTGHYVQRIMNNNRAELHKAVNHLKDQSYFLFTISQDQLNYLRFPLGALHKSKTRELARRFELKVSDKPDSQDICFVPNGDYASIVNKIRPGALDPGEIVHISGAVLGSHQGTIKYTIGQRKGLGISSSKPLYVVKIDPVKKQIILGPREALSTQTIHLKEINWLEDNDLFKNGFRCEVKIRSTNAPIPAKIFSTSKDTAIIELENPEYGIAFGQACVFYSNERVLGGGWINEEVNE